MATVAQSNFIFGLRRGVTNNLCFLDDQTVVFPSGNNCIRYNIDQKWQKFIPGTERSLGLQAMALSANRRYLAVSESGEKPTITVYDLTHEQGRKRKLLTAGDGPAGEFLCMAFSPNSKYLVGQSGGPTWTLVLWLWERQKVLATVSSSDGDPVSQVSFNPLDDTQLCVSGPGLVCLLNYREGVLKRQSPAKVKGVAVLCHAWVSGTRVVAGTDQGRLLMVESGELRWDLDASITPGTLGTRPHQISSRFILYPPLSSNGEGPGTTPTSGAGPGATPPSGEGRGVTAILAYSKGFMCSVGPGTVCVFENTEEMDSYRKTRELLIPPDPCTYEPGRAQQQQVATLCLSPGEDTLALSTQQGQLYAINLISTEISRGEPAHFEFLSSSFHTKSITGLSVCIRKPLVASCSLDRSVRVWNYDTNVLELYKEFQEEALSVSLHPSGLFLLVGFTDKLRVMNLLIDDIRTVKELTLRGCPECVFSHGGHLFAAINGNVIHIYSVTTFDNMLTLKGHNGKVSAVAWSADDSRLVSCGTDGAVYEWNAHSGKRESENVLKSCVYAGVAVSSDARTIFAAGTSLKEIQDSQVLRELSGDDVTYTALALSRSGKVIFTGTSSGTVRVVRNPLPLQQDWTEYQAHCGPVTKVLVTFDDQLLLTASGDGSLMVWRILDKESRRDKELSYTEEILITKTDLEEKNQNMQELKTRVEELRMEKEYQLRLSDSRYNEKIKELSDTFILEIQALKAKNQVDSQKLLLEYSKNLEQQRQSTAQQEENEARLEALEQSHARALGELRLSYQEQLQHTSQHQQAALESRRQAEEDSELEVQTVQQDYEERLYRGGESYLTLKGEAGIMRKQLDSLRREVEERCEDIERLKKEAGRLQGVIRSLETDILGLKKEISERVETIQDKERVICDQGKKNQELEKINFLRNSMLEEQKKSMAPRDSAITEMKAQIQEVVFDVVVVVVDVVLVMVMQMEAELKLFHEENTQLELHVSDLKLKLRATAKERNKEMQKVKQSEGLVRRFQVDLHRCAALLQEPGQLKKAVQEMYGCYIRPGDVVEIVGVDEDIQREWARQRDHLEKTVSSLKVQQAKDSEQQQQKNLKLMRVSSLNRSLTLTLTLTLTLNLTLTLTLTLLLARLLPGELNERIGRWCASAPRVHDHQEPNVVIKT
uniref:EML-like second beta-propeller domain-containing protein n=1 Tax=Gadus morhua TaxID=8049 RepID=A0A8C4Z5Q7_GADMO